RDASLNLTAPADGCKFLRRDPIPSPGERGSTGTCAEERPPPRVRTPEGHCPSYRRPCIPSRPPPAAGRPWTAPPRSFLDTRAPALALRVGPLEVLVKEGEGDPGREPGVPVVPRVQVVVGVGEGEERHLPAGRGEPLRQPLRLVQRDDGISRAVD